MIEFQRLLLGDKARNDAFVRALKAVIVPNVTTVADIGSGTGFLSFVAEKFGAKECYLYETSDALTLSEKIAKANGIKRCNFFAKHSTEVKNPPQTDVVVSETLGNWAYEENIIENMNDARRFLKASGTVIPQSVDCFIAPVTSPRLYEDINVWDRIGHGLDFSVAKDQCQNNIFVKDIVAEDLLADPKSRTKWDSVDLRKKNSSVREKTIEWTLQSNETLYGFACWWESLLTENISLSTSPFEPSTHWKQIFLPLVDPLTVKKGQTIRLKLQSDSRYAVKINVTWETAVINGDSVIKKVTQDMRRGYSA